MKHYLGIERLLKNGERLPDGKSIYPKYCVLTLEEGELPEERSGLLVGAFERGYLSRLARDSHPFQISPQHLYGKQGEILLAAPDIAARHGRFFVKRFLNDPTIEEGIIYKNYSPSGAFWIGSRGEERQLSKDGEATILLPGDSLYLGADRQGGRGIFRFWVPER